MSMQAALVAAGVVAPLARIWVNPLARACARMGIDSPQRFAALVSQCAHESAGFSRLEEGLFYTSADRIVRVFGTRAGSPEEVACLVRNSRALANRVYAFRNGNLDEASGDGWAYRGRGLLQLTGRGNYMAAELALGEPYCERPDMLLEPEHAALTAAWYFSSHGCLAMADRGDVAAITRAINGPAMLGLDERRKRYLAALEAFK